MPRAIFEEVADESRAARTVAAPGEADRIKRRNRRAIAIWLLVVAVLMAGMVIFGGLTRQTDRRPSIAGWELVTEAIPPMSDADWAAEFDKYKMTPEFAGQSQWMTGAEFKSVYWREWAHRLLEWLIRLAFALPFVWFAARRMIPAGWAGKLGLVFALGAAREAISWWMASPGLAQRPDVASCRLAVDLGLTFLIFTFLLSYALQLSREEWELLQARRRREGALMGWAEVLTGIAFAQVLFGALAAGLDAGRNYTDWPSMDGAFLSPRAFEGTPLWTYSFETAVLVQFSHWIAAYLLLIVAAGLWFKARKSAAVPVRRWASWLVVAALGVAVLQYGAPPAWGAAHQLGALLLFAVLIRVKHEVAYPREDRIARG